MHETAATYILEVFFSLVLGFLLYQKHATPNNSWLSSCSHLVYSVPLPRITPQSGGEPRELFQVLLCSWHIILAPAPPPPVCQDRPHTLEWIIKYNIWPGELMIVFFAHLFRLSNQRDLVYILVFVTGVGDGLAEPVI